MSARHAAIRVAVVRFVIAQLGNVKDHADAVLMGYLDPGDRKHAVLDDGSDIATVSVTNGRKKPKVHDPAAFLDWVREHAPTEVEQPPQPPLPPERVRPSYVTALTDNARVIDGLYVHEQTGEVIPGITQDQGNPYVSVRFSDAQTDALIAALADGTINVADATNFLNPTPELEPGEPT